MALRSSDAYDPACRTRCEPDEGDGGDALHLQPQDVTIHADSTLFRARMLLDLLCDQKEEEIQQMEIRDNSRILHFPSVSGSSCAQCILDCGITAQYCCIDNFIKRAGILRHCVPGDTCLSACLASNSRILHTQKIVTKAMFTYETRQPHNIYMAPTSDL